MTPTDPIITAEDLDAMARQAGHPNSRAGTDWEAFADALKGAAKLIRSLATPWRTSEEAAAHVRMSVRTLEGYRTQGGGPAYHRRDGGKVLYHRRDLDEWVAKGRAAHTAEEKLGSNSK